MTDADVSIIEKAFETRSSITPETGRDVKGAVDRVLTGLDQGRYRIAEKVGNDWIVHEWLKKAVLLSFRLFDNQMMSSELGQAYDKVPLKFDGWSEKDFRKSGIRAVPGSVVRRGSFIGRGAVLMPSFVNIGAYVGEGTMVDTWATIGSCAQIGKNVHISGGAGIGGVLEPLQAAPVIIEDNCFIGARSEVAEGVIVHEGAVLAMGVYLGASIPIIDRETGKVSRGVIPPYSVVVPGTISPKETGGPATYAAVIIKQVDEKTRAKTSINDLLRP